MSGPMKKMQIWKIFAILGMTAVLSGCWSSREVDSLGILVGLGVDKSEVPGQLDVTAQVVIPSAIGSAGDATTGGGQPAFFNFTMSGESVIGILHEMTHQLSRRLYPSHTQVLVVGAEQARQSMQPCIDLFIRDHEERLNVQVLISEGRAEELLNTEIDLEKVPAVNLERLIQAQFATSTSAPVQIIEYLKGQLSESAASYTPLAATITEEDSMVAHITGIALLQDGRLTGFLRNKTARGLIFAKDKVKSGILEIPLADDSVQLEIIKSKTKTSIHLNSSNQATFKVEVRMTANIAGKVSREDIRTEAAIKQLEQEAAQKIEKEIEDAYYFAAAADTDVFLTGDMIWKSYPTKWTDLQNDWRKRLKEVNLAVNARVVIHGTGRQTKPII